ncbi:hypothetical protein [Moraxella marmotae]|uniref:hypothetical protein n=1 Tax=Moraxella marmotae TaxID=3344520 RepID=UPI0035F3BA47
MNFLNSKSQNDYYGFARNFVDNPLAGTLTKVRNNGDVLFYQPSTNTFAIKDKNGIIKTVFNLMLKNTNMLQIWSIFMHNSNKLNRCKICGYYESNWFPWVLMEKHHLLISVPDAMYSLAMKIAMRKLSQVTEKKIMKKSSHIGQTKFTLQCLKTKKARKRNKRE